MGRDLFATEDPATEPVPVEAGRDLFAVPPSEPSVAGALDVIGAGGSELLTQAGSGLAGLTLGRSDVSDIVESTEAVKSMIPDYQLGEEGKEFAKYISEKYKEYAPEFLNKFVAAVQQAPEEVFQAGMDTAERLEGKGHDFLASMTRKGAPVAAAVTGAIPTAAEALPAAMLPRIIGKGSAVTQRALSPEKRAIAEQLERGAVEGDYIPAGSPSTGTDLVPVPGGGDVAPTDPWTKGELQTTGDDLGLKGYTTTTAPYSLNKYGKVIDNPKYKIAKEAGFSDALLGLTERASKETKAKYKKMVDSRERLYEIPERSDIYDPVLVTGGSLAERLNIVKSVNKFAGKAIDKYVNSNLAKVEINTLPLMDKVSEIWASKGVNLNTRDWSIDYGDLELSTKGQNVINKLLSEMKEISKKPTGRTVHNLKRRIDEDIAYGKTVDGMDAKTQDILKDFRRTTKEFLENQFPEYGRANFEYSKTVDIINRVQKAAGKVDLDGAYTMGNLGRMSRAIMSQRVGRDAILEAIRDLDDMAGKYRGSPFKDDLQGQVHLANQLDDIWGPSRATGFAGQSKQGSASAAADLAGGGIQGGAAVGRKALELLKKKQMEDKKKFKALKDLLK